jgi:hypothetical protein
VDILLKEALPEQDASEDLLLLQKENSSLKVISSAKSNPISCHTQQFHLQ